MKKRLIIIGGGYAGLILVDKLKNYYNITLIDQNEFHIEQTEIHRYLSNKIEKDKLTFSYEDFALKKFIIFIKAKITNIDFKKKEVLYDNEVLEYDSLVIATGSVSFFPKQIKNLGLYKNDIKFFEVIESFKEEFNNLLNSNPKNKNILIAGGGLSGVEISIELAEKIKKLNFKKEEIKITIVEQQPTILPSSNEYLINKTKEVLDNLEIECVHGEFITEVQEDKIILGNKEEISYDLSLFVLGVISKSIGNVQNLEVNIKEQYIVNEYFEINPYKDAYCIGDAAQTYTPDGKYNLPTGQMANMQAKLLAKNLINKVKNKPLLSKKLILKGVLIDLGGKNAVGLIFNKYKISGNIAYLLKRLTSYLHKIKFK